MPTRRIAIITGTRAEFGLLEPVLAALDGCAKVKTQLIVTGMHLLPQFGRTINDIRRAGWPIAATVRMQSGADDVTSEALAAGRGISGIARSLRRLRSEIVVVLGDRIEAFAGATAAALSRIPVAHIHGGDRATGQTDESLRNAITRLAHIHLAASADAVARLERMGEAPWRIHRVGAPGLDDIAAHLAQKSKSKPSSRVPGPHSNEPPYAVIVQHPASSDANAEYVIMGGLLQAVAKAGLIGHTIYPNSDPGHSGIIRAIHETKRLKGWRLHRSLPRPEYLRLVHGARLLIGNSSSGIIESASLGVTALNIGPRQQGRLRCGDNVVDVSDRPAAIFAAIRRALRSPCPPRGRSVYGNGRAGERIAKILTGIAVDNRLLTKDLTF